MLTSSRNSALRWITLGHINATLSFLELMCHKTWLCEAPPRPCSVTLLCLCLFLSCAECFPTAAENSVLQVFLNSPKVNNMFIEPKTNQSCRKCYLPSTFYCPHNKYCCDFGVCKEYASEAVYCDLAIQIPLMPMGVMLVNLHTLFGKSTADYLILYSLMQAEELWCW